MGRTYLLTGVTGFLGKVVLEELVRRRDELGLERVYVPIRPRDGQAPAERFREVAASPCFAKLPAGWTNVVEVLDATLEQAGLGLNGRHDQVSREVTHIVHAAASVSFDLPLAEAAASNVEAALNVLAFAQACPRLQRMVAVSTAYVTPHTGGTTPGFERLTPLPIPAAELLDDIRRHQHSERHLLRASGHPNTYTLTKSMAEHLLIARRGHVPLSIVRPSIISASLHHPFPGWIDSKAGFAGFVVLLGAGHLRAVVGHGDSKLDLVPVDEVADRVLAACDDTAPEPVIRHAAAGAALSPTIADCWEGIRSFYAANRVARTPALRYIGPRDLRFRMADALHHGVPVAMASLQGREMRRRSRSLRGILSHVNRAFPYFTSNSFDFHASVPLDHGFEPKAYVQVVCRGVHQHVLKGDPTEWTLAGRRHPGHGGDLAWARRQPNGNSWIRFASWIVTKVLRRTTEQVTVDVPSFERARRAVPEGSALVLVATHRSYLDFILVSYLAFARPDLGIPIPYIAATMEFGTLPVLGKVLTALHAFYLRRGTGKEDPELTRRVHDLIEQGRTLEFFIEGSRSRTRAFLEPKRGLLRCLQATGKPVTILPVSLSYDRIPEERTFAAELSGSPKPTMKLGSLLAWTARAMAGKVRLGRAHIACGAPIQLDPDGDIPAVSHAIMQELRDATIATTYHLEAYLQHHPQPGWTPQMLRGAIEARGGKVLPSKLPVPKDLDPRIAATLRNQFSHRLPGGRLPVAEQDGLVTLTMKAAQAVQTGARPRDEEVAMTE
jgi:1-acyl-sn-glycerol-3-phosphate acyltransferase